MEVLWAADSQEVDSQDVDSQEVDSQEVDFREAVLTEDSREECLTEVLPEEDSDSVQERHFRLHGQAAMSFWNHPICL